MPGFQHYVSVHPYPFPVAPARIRKWGRDTAKRRKIVFGPASPLFWL